MRWATDANVADGPTIRARAAPLLGAGVDLEVRQEIVREGDELLPGAVGG